MNFKWNARLRSTAGACFNKRSVKINENLDCERISRIELSTKVYFQYNITFCTCLFSYFLLKIINIFFIF